MMKRRRLFALLLALVMVISLAPMTAFAADGEPTEIGAAEVSEPLSDVTEETTEPSTEATESTTDPAPVCDCGTDDPAIHATTCGVYVAPENPVCFCAEKCTEANIWCDVCGVDFTQCSGTDTAAVYEEAATSGDCGVEGSSVQWKYDNAGTITISGTGAMASYDANKQPWYTYMDSITAVVVEDGVTVVARDSFDSFTSLKSVTIADSVVELGMFCFEGCTKLESVHLSSNLTTMGQSAFGYCSSLTSIEIPQSVTFMDYSVFKYCENLTSIEIPSGVTELKSKTFEHCTNLTSVTLPDTLTKIEPYAFDNCTSLASIEIPNSVTELDDYAFRDCTSLASIEIPNSVTVLGKGAFWECTALTEIKLPNALQTIPLYAFWYCSNLKDITIPASVKSVHVDTSFTGIAASAVVHYLGTEEQFNAVFSKVLTKAAKHYCVEKDVTLPLCNEPGHESGWYCDTCAKYVDGGAATSIDPDNHAFSEKGICTRCGAYEAPALVNGYYEIGNMGELYWFAQQVNNGKTTINAILMNDIEINAQVLDADGNLISDTSGLRQWTPIGHYNSATDNLGFAGTFDGNGKTISGLYHYGDTARYAGLFGNSSGMIQDLTIADSYIHTTHSDGRAGSVTGSNEGTVSNCSNYGFVIGYMQIGGIAGWNSGTVEKCSNSGTVKGDNIVGGIAGITSDGTINDCYNLGSVEAASGVGGIAGWIQRTSNISNCISVGTVNGSSQAGGVVGFVINNSTTNVTITNCYHDNTVCGYDPIGVNGGSYASATVTSVEGKTSEQFASGEVAYLLGTAWGQTIGTDSYPVLGGEKVYKITVCETKTAYSNTDGGIPHSFNENGFCSVTEGETHYQPATLNAEGYYEIGNAGQMFWFANYINTVDRTASAVLTADIDLENRPWTPIGSTGESSNNFRGVFDGQNHIIKGLYVEGSRAGLGFFGEVRTGTVKNFTIYGKVNVIGSYDYVGGVIGSACGLNGENDLARNGATIQNITSYVDLTAGAHGIGMVGGFIGYANHQTLIENCAWYGTFDAGIYRVDSGAGGFIGRIYDTATVTIRNCGAYGDIITAYKSGTHNNQATIYIGGFLSYSPSGANTVLENNLWAGRIINNTNLTEANAHLSAYGTMNSSASKTNCYALEGTPYVTTGNDNTNGITTVTAEQLKSGKIAYLLQNANEIWGQNIDTDAYPVLGGDKVYQVKNCKQEIAYNNSTADIGHNYVNGICTVCDEACEHTGGTATCTTLAVCDICGASYGEVDKTNHDETVAYVNGFCPNGCYEPAVRNGNVYEISNAGQLYWFAAQVNGRKNSDAKLTANIVVNENVLTADGELNGDGSEFRHWTPIGNEDVSYTGTFDGNGYTVSGLYFNDSTINCVGLFGEVFVRSVKNVGVIDSYLKGGKNVGGVVGCNNFATVENCYNSGTVIGTEYVGGVVGDNSETVQNCHNTGVVSGTEYVGGVVGHNTDTVQNCHNTGVVSGTDSVGGVVGYNWGGGTVQNCYNTGTVEGYDYLSSVGGVVGYNMKTVQNCYNTGTIKVRYSFADAGGVVGYNFDGTVTNTYYLDTVQYGGINGDNVEGQAEAKTAAQFASGEVAYLLQGEQTEQVWGQNIGTDAYPVLGGDKVYQVKNCKNENIYSNTNENIDHSWENGVCTNGCGITHDPHTYENGICTVCGAAAPFAFYGTNMTLGNELDLNFAIEKSLVNDEDIYAIITRSYSDGREAVTSGKLYVNDWDGKQYENLYLIIYPNLAAKEMCDTVSVTVYDKDGKELGSREDSIRSYAMRTFDNVEPMYKTLFVEMLDYGAMAQTHFAYNADDLANSQLTESHRTFALSESKALADHSSSDTTSYMGTSLILENRIEMQMGFVGDPTGVTAQVSYTDHYGNSKSFSGNDVTIKNYYDTNDHTKVVAYGVVIPEIVVADARQLVTVTLTLADNTSLKVIDSMESYAARQSNGDDIYRAVMDFADAAYASFHPETNEEG